MAKEIKINNSTEKTTQELIISAVQELKTDISHDKYPRQKMLVKFKKPVYIRHNHRVEKEETIIELSFFFSASNKLCYSCRNNPSTGYYVTRQMFDEMESITIFTESELFPTSEVNKFIRKFHPNLWSNIVEELNNDPSKMKTRYYNNFNTMNISSKFPSFVIRELKDAIENKKDYSYHQSGTKRDMSVSTKLGEDGVFRAWFSSEFSGCANGSYYILINPTTAALKEDD